MPIPSTGMTDEQWRKRARSRYAEILDEPFWKSVSDVFQQKAARRKGQKAK